MSVVPTLIHNRAHRGDPQEFTVGYATLRVTNGHVAFHQEDRVKVVGPESDEALDPTGPGFAVALTPAEYSIEPVEVDA